VRRGFLRSPNWPGEYPAGVDCEWTIGAERGRHVLVVVSRVELAPAAAAAAGDISPTHDPRHCTHNATSTSGDRLSISDTSGVVSFDCLGLNNSRASGCN